MHAANRTYFRRGIIVMHVSLDSALLDTDHPSPATFSFHHWAHGRPASRRPGRAGATTRRITPCCNDVHVLATATCSRHHTEANYINGLPSVYGAFSCGLWELRLDTSKIFHPENCSSHVQDNVPCRLFPVPSVGASYRQWAVCQGVRSALQQLWHLRVYQKLQEVRGPLEERPLSLRWRRYQVLCCRGVMVRAERDFVCIIRT